MYSFKKSIATSVVLLLCATQFISQAQQVSVGSGSYTTQFPGKDAAGRNEYPSGTPYLTGAAANKPAPTNDWWSKKIKEAHASNLFNYPYTLKTVNAGLVTTYIPWGVIDDISPVTVGVQGLNASAAKISDFTDWTITMDWANGSHHFQATTGIAMPFIYFTKGDDDVAQITVSQGSAQIQNEMLIITDARNGADFAIYAPSGSVWTQEGSTYTSSLNGKNYWSMAFIPLTASNVTTVANEYKKYAYVFPTNTSVAWNYDESNAVMRTDFEVETEIKEGSNNTVLMGLLPHQWANLASDSPQPNGYSYATVRGTMKTLAGNSFSVAHTFQGILPTLPYLDYYSDDFSPQSMNEKVTALENDGLSTWTDSYNEGQVMNRLIQTARIADLMGNETSKAKIIETIKSRLENWLTANSGEVAFMFYYNETWSAMIGYPAGHGQDGNINDHHFHWGYFIHAAAFVEQYEPGWASQWGEMVNLLVRDAASPDRDDEMFPFLRNFSPYAGHCWANGFASFPQGNDQESTSESMQFNSSLIHWGSITGNKEIRDLGIYLYTTEHAAIDEYWFDQYDRNFKSDQSYSLVSRIWGNSYDNGTFWTNDIAASYGIELYPIHGGSLYLGHNHDYAEKLWTEMEKNTGILKNEANDNLWHDVYWKYLSLTDPEKAISLYNSNPDRSLKFGISDAQTYHWLHAMNVLGRVDTDVTANHPLATVFKKNNERTYVAQNYGKTDIKVTFSDGYELSVAAQSLATSKDLDLKAELESNFDQASAGGSVLLDVTVSEGSATKVEFWDGNEKIGETNNSPYRITANDLSLGKHGFSARIYDGDMFTISNLVFVTVGEQKYYFGEAQKIPGTIEAGHYDVYEGGIGQGIAYSDDSQNNQGDFREDEYVDVAKSTSEGSTIGWIGAGEWVEYTVDVEQAGLYTMNFRYASGNSNGGGPFRIQSDGSNVSTSVKVSNTSGWDKWRSQTVSDIALKSGEQVLRLNFETGEFNLGKMTFSYSKSLPYSQPVANAGENILVITPSNSTTLDGTASSDPKGGSLNYEWSQIYGPSNVNFSNANVQKPQLTTLQEGVYLIRLKVSNGSGYIDEDDVLVIVSDSQNIDPEVSITSPTHQSTFLAQSKIIIQATASDLVGEVDYVEFYQGGLKLGTDYEKPYEWEWSNNEGTYLLSAIAYDNDGGSGQSKEIEVTIDPAPSCIGTASNGDFSYEFSDDESNPTLTFIPTGSGTGSPTCLLYYGTNANSLPGHIAKPNVPFKLNASKGSTIYFYYTYSYLGGGEKNTAGDKIAYKVGSCVSEVDIVTSSEDIAAQSINIYPNPTSNILNIGSSTSPLLQWEIIDMTGKQLMKSHAEQLSHTGIHQVDMTALHDGIYFIRITQKDEIVVRRVVKN